VNRLRPSPILLLSLLVLSAFFSGLALTSCARQTLERSRTSAGTRKQPAESELEAIPAPVSPQKKAVQSPETRSYIEEKEPPRVEETSGEGFRVQIFASSSLEKAETVARQARTVFSESVYVEYSAPLYRVRVGDFSTKEQALEMKEKAVRAGYEGAWVAAVSAER
jgi:cell division septation protein DedD